jgi:biofilm PGA synthesis N-glycosyltransferase PgaC
MQIMLLIKIIFWISFFILFYTYIGYGIILFLVIKIKSPGSKIRLKPDVVFEPEVSIIIASYNEAPILKEKIINSLELNYPADKLKIIIVTDGSTDESPAIIKSFGTQIQLYHSRERKGKVAAINRAMELIKTPFVIFSDCNTMLNKSSVKQIIQHYKDEKVGAVAGEKKVVTNNEKADAAGAGEGLYWKYESLLKKMDSAFYTVVGAAGELFSVRTNLFEPVATNVLLDDFIISMKVCQRGYKVIYEPNAFASETPSFSMKDEQNRKIRISAGAIQSVLMLKDLLNIFKYGKLSFQYISHRVLRWIACPILIPLTFICSFILMVSTNKIVYSVLFFFQVIFFIMAISGWLLASRNIKIKSLFIPYYFMFMNLTLYIGFARYFNNTQSVLWDKAKRKNNNR